MYVGHEAALSSQFQGRQSELDDVLPFEMDANGKGLPKDVEEVVNYVPSMHFGLERIHQLRFNIVNVMV